MREYLKVYVPIALLVIVGFVAAFQLVNPAPPSSLRMAAGQPEGAYAAFAERYKAILARDGIRLDIVPSSGAIENLRLLKADEGGVDVAFVQGGTGIPDDAPGLVSLASVFFEPLWVFVRGKKVPDRLGDLAGRRVAIGVEGSGTKVIAQQLLAASGITATSATFVEIGGNQAVDALLAGKVDAAFFVTARPVPQLQKLLEAENVRLMSFAQADAYTFRYPYLSRVTLPAGVIRLDPVVPQRDVTLLAPAAALVAREDLHPALIDLLLRAAREVHRPRQLFSKLGEFPSQAYVDFPLDPQAQRNLESGPTFLRRYLPFWGANLVERLWVLVLPLVTIAIPLMRIASPTYRWQVRRKIYRWYKHLRTIEDEAWQSKDPDARDKLLDRIDDLQRSVGKLAVPLAHAEQLYHLRLHIAFLRDRVATMGAAPHRPAD